PPIIQAQTGLAVIESLSIGFKKKNLRANIISVYGMRLVQYGERKRPEPPNSDRFRGSGHLRSPYRTVHAIANRYSSLYLCLMEMNHTLPATESGNQKKIVLGYLII